MMRLFDHKHSSHHELLNESVVMSLVGYFEVLIADLMGAFYRLTPDAVTTDDKVLSIRELRSFNSINEALELVISRRVDDALRGGLYDWNKFFSRNFKIELQELVWDWPSWCEVFQRRHIIVHNAGVADRRYLSQIDWDAVTQHLTKPKEGHQIDVGDEYVAYTLDLFEIAGEALVQGCWRKIEPADDNRLLHLHSVIYEALETKRWLVTEHLAAWGIQDETANESMHLVFIFNRWLAIKRQTRWSEVVDEVRKFDCSAKHPRFALTRASLLEDSDEFFRLLPSATLSKSELDEWPILDEMRSDPRFESAAGHGEPEPTLDPETTITSGEL
jgi:hypothetical protein